MSQYFPGPRDLPTSRSRKFASWYSRAFGTEANWGIRNGLVGTLVYLRVVHGRPKPTNSTLRDSGWNISAIVPAANPWAAGMSVNRISPRRKWSQYLWLNFLISILNSQWSRQRIGSLDVADFHDDDNLL